MAAIQYISDIDLNKNQMLNALLHNSATHPLTPKLGQIYWNTVDIAAYIWTGTVWLNLGELYVHPTYAAMNPTLTGANVLASFQVNEEGHVIASSTRLLTLDDLGYTGATDANNYLHPTFTGNTLAGPLAGATIVSDVEVNAEGHVTNFVTRELTAADIGAAIINDSVTNGINTWSSSKIQAKLDEINSAVAGALVYKGDYNASTNTPNLDSAPAGILVGYTYAVSAAGNFFTEAMQPGDMLIAEIDNPTTLAHWSVINKNIPDIVDATDTVKGIIRLATQAEVDAGILNNVAVSPATLVAFYNSMEAAAGFTADIGDGTSLVFDVAHGLGSKLIQVEVYNNSTGSTVMVPVQRTTTNNIRISTNVPPTAAQYKVLMKKVA